MKHRCAEEWNDYSPASRRQRGLPVGANGVMVTGSRKVSCTHAQQVPNPRWAPGSGRSPTRLSPQRCHCDAIFILLAGIDFVHCAVQCEQYIRTTGYSYSVVYLPAVLVQRAAINRDAVPILVPFSRPSSLSLMYPGAGALEAIKPPRSVASHTSFLRRRLSCFERTCEPAGLVADVYVHVLRIILGPGQRPHLCPLCQCV